MNAILQDFLITEISNQGLYDDIIQFIESPHIRKGEFECNTYIIKKLNLDNFILFPDYIYYPNNRSDIEVYNSILINKEQLIKIINEHAKIENLL